MQQCKWQSDHCLINQYFPDVQLSFESQLDHHFIFEAEKHLKDLITIYLQTEITFYVKHNTNNNLHTDPSD